jgi:hypothetical protein
MTRATNVHQLILKVRCEIQGERISAGQGDIVLTTEQNLVCRRQLEDLLNDLPLSFSRHEGENEAEVEIHVLVH